MSTTGLDVFDKTVQSTRSPPSFGPDRHVAWHVAAALPENIRGLRPLRDNRRNAPAPDVAEGHR